MKSAMPALFLAATLLPAYLEAQTFPTTPSADESAAVGALRTINTAEAVYANTYNAGYSPTLKVLGPPPKGGQPSATAADLVDNSLTGGKKHGYTFTYKAGPPDSMGHIDTYAVTARPIRWRRGLKNFYTDQTGVIRWTLNSRQANTLDPAI